MVQTTTFGYSNPSCNNKSQIGREERGRPEERRRGEESRVEKRREEQRIEEKRTAYLGYVFAIQEGDQRFPQPLRGC